MMEQGCKSETLAFHQLLPPRFLHSAALLVMLAQRPGGGSECSVNSAPLSLVGVHRGRNPGPHFHLPFCMT